MLLYEFNDYLLYAVELYERLAELEQQGETNLRMHELYKEYNKILKLEAVTDSIKNLQDFLEIFGEEIENYCNLYYNN